MHESEAERTGISLPVCRLLGTCMKIRASLILLSLVAVAPLSAGSKFVASDVPGAKVPPGGKIVIRNTTSSITAVQFDGNIERALVTLRSSRSLSYRPYGPSLFESSAPFNASSSGPYHAIIREAASTHGVDPRLIVAVAKRESAMNPRAVSRVGAQGLMQLMPATAAFLGIADSFDPRQNVFAGTRYLRMLLDTFRGDLDMTLAAYNAGPGAVQKYRGIPPYRETRAYVTAVRTEYERSLR